MDASLLITWTSFWFPTRSLQDIPVKRCISPWCICGIWTKLFSILYENRSAVELSSIICVFLGNTAAWSYCTCHIVHVTTNFYFNHVKCFVCWNWVIQKWFRRRHRLCVGVYVLSFVIQLSNSQSRREVGLFGQSLHWLLFCIWLHSSYCLASLSWKACHAWPQGWY